ncbi:hypothetical protein [Escherichia coli]|uniref:hypothetical protein n=1 Tax=Escherichia coli TaxID=562 RepID=UPI003F4E6274
MLSSDEKYVFCLPLSVALYSGVFAFGASMILGGVAQILAPKAKTPAYRATDNGKQKTYFSSLDNMTAQGNQIPVTYGGMMAGSRRISQSITTLDEAGDGKWVS